MAFRLTKAELKQRDDLLERVRTLTGKLEDEIAVANAQIESTIEHVNGFVSALNEAIGDVETFQEAVRDRLQEEFDEKSERWQEGDRGQEAADFISQWEFSVTEVETFETVTLELSPPDAIDELERAPEEVG